MSANAQRLEADRLEQEIYQLTQKLYGLRRASDRAPVADYEFATATGPVSLRALFEQQDQLLVIHNMGQGCRFCTLWADGLNGLLPHLEAALSVVLVSEDPPSVQRQFAGARGWRFRMASHGGGRYIQEQSVVPGEDNMPGAVVYERAGEQLYRRSSAVFGPGDLYCPAWGLLALAGIGEPEFTPQYRYWTPPATLDDGGSAPR